MISIPAIAMAAAFLTSPTATIQGTPVCLPHTAHPGHSYQLSVYGEGAFSVIPAPDGTPERGLGQVPSSWVTFGGNNLTSPGTVSITLTIPADARPGPYWSDINAADPSSGNGQVKIGTAATAGLIFAVGTTPPPCDAISEAYSTGRMPPWPSKKFATSNMRQLLQRGEGPMPVTSPTANIPGATPQSTVKPNSQQQPGVVNPTPVAAAKSNPAPWIIIAGAVFAFLLLGWYLHLPSQRRR